MSDALPARTSDPSEDVRRLRALLALLDETILQARLIVSGSTSPIAGPVPRRPARRRPSSSRAGQAGRNERKRRR